MQKLLITGGAGFIGSAVIRYLIKHTQHQVINLDKLTYAGNLENLTEVSSNKRYTFEQVDICDAAEIKRVLQQHQPNIIMHLAAESHVDRSIDGPAAFIETNILGTYTLLEAAREYWNTLPKTEQQTFRFHHVSTDEVYGDLPHPDDAAKTAASAKPPRSDKILPVIASAAKQSFAKTATSAKPPRSDELPLFTETTAYAPSSPYSASKASSDHLVRAWQRTYGLPIVVTNCSNNYGPYHFPEKLIPHVILNALAGKSLPIYGDGSQIRDWLYVEDHAEALVLVATQGKNGQTYNIGGHNEKRNLEVVETICQILDELRPLKTATSATPPRSDDISPVVANNPPVIASGSEAISSYKQLITHVADRPGHDRRYAIDASKIEQEFGWKPKETFETGLRKTVQWYLDNEAWWQNVLNGNYRLTRIGTNNT